MTRISFLLPILFCSAFALAQVPLSTKNKKAIELYTIADNFRVRAQYGQAIELLNQAIEKDKNFFEAYYRRGLVYFTLKKYQLAITDYETGLALTDNPNKQKVFWYELGDSYFAIGNYDVAAKFFSDFLKVELLNKPKIEKANLMLRNAEFAKQNSSNTSRYKLRALSDTVNCFVMQYFPALTADQKEIIFTRRVGNGPNDDEDLVIARKNKNGQWTSPVSISKNINTGLNEGTCTISADGRKLIFTSCVGRDGIGSCDLYESIKTGDAWSEPVNLGHNVNSLDWESQPSLSADGRTLYFISDRNGGVGRRDVWVSSLNNKGQWTKAKNVGKPVNTVFDEISPFIHVNNRVLYFASNGLTGFGGYDIFYSELDTANKWTRPVNIGLPINNQEDQFSLFITADGSRGYYSHEETGPAALTFSKIYEVRIPEENQVKFRSNYVKGIIRDKQTRRPLAATVELIDIAKNTTESLVKSDSITGEYLIVLTQGAEYALYVTKKEYLFTSKNFNYTEVKNFTPITLDFHLDKAKAGSMAVLNNIFFDFDKYEILEKSKTELQKVVRFLLENPSLAVEISGHTDNKGAAGYNLQLSEKRARSVYAYMVENGIQAKRLSYKGYGASHPVTSNATEEERQVNRRIEFKVK